MRQISVKVGAGNDETISVVGDYVRVKTALVPVRLRDENGGLDATIEQGDALNLKQFERLRVSHSDAAEQTIVLLIGNGTKADSAKVGGSVSISGGSVGVSSLPAPAVVSPSLLQANMIVTSASAIPWAALNESAARRYLLIQNKSATGTVWVNFGAAASPVNGIRLLPGESFESTGVAVIGGGVRMVGDIASNPDVVAVVG